MGGFFAPPGFVAEPTCDDSTVNSSLLPFQVRRGGICILQLAAGNNNNNNSSSLVAAIFFFVPANNHLQDGATRVDGRRQQQPIPQRRYYCARLIIPTQSLFDKGVSKVPTISSQRGKICRIAYRRKLLLNPPSVTWQWSTANSLDDGCILVSYHFFPRR